MSRLPNLKFILHVPFDCQMVAIRQAKVQDELARHPTNWHLKAKVLPPVYFWVSCSHSQSAWFPRGLPWGFIIVYVFDFVWGVPSLSCFFVTRTQNVIIDAKVSGNVKVEIIHEATTTIQAITVSILIHASITSGICLTIGVIALEQESDLWYEMLYVICCLLSHGFADQILHIMTPRLTYLRGLLYTFYTYMQLPSGDRTGDMGKSSWSKL